MPWGVKLGPVIAIDGAPENIEVLSAWSPRYWAEMARNVPRWLLHADLMRSRSVHSLMWSLSKHAIALGKGAVGLRRTEKLGGGYAIDRVMDLSLYPPAQRRVHQPAVLRDVLVFSGEYPGEVVVYEAKVTPLLYLPQVGRSWRKVAPRSEIVSVVGTHIGIMHDPYVSALADDLHARVTKFFAGTFR